MEEGSSSAPEKMVEGRSCFHQREGGCGMARRGQQMMGESEKGARTVGMRVGGNEKIVLTSKIVENDDGDGVRQEGMK